jgi:Transposase
VFTLTALGPKEAEMRIIGCDLHARQQTLAMLDTATGEVVSMTRKHEGNHVREFYSSLPRPVRVGIEATGSMQWFVNLMEELGIECLVGHPAQIRAAQPRKQKHDRRDADLILKLLAEKRFPAIWLPSKELLDLRDLLLPPSVGAHTDTHSKRAAGHCLSQRVAPRSKPVELRRASEDRIPAVRCPMLLTGGAHCKACTGRWKKKSKT